MASPAQINYVYSLAAGRDTTSLDSIVMAWINTPLALQNANNDQVNQILTALKALPYKSQTPDQAARAALGVPAPPDTAATPQPTPFNELKELEGKTMKGRYFIVDPTDDVEKFFVIEKPEAPSRWAGYTFIKVQASDYFYPIKDPKHKVAILRTIAEDPIKAMNEYGQRLGVCGYCGRTLTARDSRLRGLGPICAGKILGQATDEQVTLLQRLGLIK